MIELILDRTLFAPGDQVTGSVHVIGERAIRGVSVTLESQERSGRRRHRSETVTSVDIDVSGHSGSTLAPFRMLLPANVVRDYRFTRSGLELFVTASADVRGIDPERHTPIQLTPAVPEGAEGIAAERANQLGIAHRPMPRHARVGGLLLLASAALMAILVAYWLLDQSSDWHAGDRTDVLFAAGYGVAALVAGVLLLLFGQGRPIDDVDLEIVSTVLQPGDPVVARVTNTSSGPVDIGLVVTERTTVGDDQGRSVVILPRRAIADWAKAPPGWSEHRFQLAHDAPPSYAGRNIGVDYQVRAVAGGPAPHWLPMRSNKQRLIVL